MPVAALADSASVRPIRTVAATLRVMVLRDVFFLMAIDQLRALILRSALRSVTWKCFRTICIIDNKSGKWKLFPHFSKLFHLRDC